MIEKSGAAATFAKAASAAAAECCAPQQDLSWNGQQLHTYMLALARRWPGKRIGGRLLFLRGGGEEVVECDFQAFEGELRRIMDAIRIRRAEQEFGILKGCDGSDCPFRQRCLIKTG